MPDGEKKVMGAKRDHQASKDGDQSFEKSGGGVVLVGSGTRKNCAPEYFSPSGETVFKKERRESEVDVISSSVQDMPEILDTA